MIDILPLYTSSNVLYCLSNRFIKSRHAIPRVS
jgi:hypothetical protein